MTDKKNRTRVMREPAFAGPALNERDAAIALGTDVERLRDWNRCGVLVPPFRLLGGEGGARFHPAIVPFGRFLAELRSMDRPELTDEVRRQLAELLAEQLVASWAELDTRSEPTAVDVDLVYADQPTVNLRFEFLAIPASTLPRVQ